MRRLLVAAGFLSLLVVTYSPLPAAPQTPSYDRPVIDAHDHIQRQLKAEDLVHLMDQLGVACMVLMVQVGDGHGSDEQALRFAQQFPGRFVPFVAFQVPLLAAPGRAVQERWTHPDAAAFTFLHDTEDKLKTGKFFGLGEMIVVGCLVADRQTPGVARSGRTVADAAKRQPLGAGKAG